MKPSAIFACAICLSACGVARPVQESDNTRVEVKTVVERVVDTAYVELPVIVERVSTLDTASVLENKYAKSAASVSGGVLTHTLETKPVKEPVAVEKQIVYRDSTVYRDRIQTVTVEVEKKLSGWQQAKLRVGGFCFFLVILIGLYLIISFIYNLNLKKTMKYIPSIAFEEMSGSAKGVTAAKMKSRKYIRNRGYGGSVRTSDQAKVKSVFKMLTTKWKTLTNEQILAWNKLALSQEGRSVLGTKAKLSGSNLFTRLNYWVVSLGGQVMVTPPEINSVEAPSAATIVCQGDTFTFKLDQAPADNGGIFLVIEATEGQSNGVSRAHKKAAAIKLVEEPTAVAVDIRSEYVAKNGAPSAAAPKIFFRYYFVDSSTGVKSQEMLVETKWAAAAAEDPGEGD